MTPTHQGRNHRRYVGPVFRRRAKKSNSPTPQTPASIFEGLRSQILDLDPSSVGMARGPGAPSTWGAVMELGNGNGVASLVCLSDGTTSLYVSTGGGMIGGGAHEAVVRANEAFLAMTAEHLSGMTRGLDHALPAEGRVIIRALTYDGPFTFEEAEDDLGYGRSPLSPVFYAAHGVLSELRLVQEKLQ